MSDILPQSGQPLVEADDLTRRRAKALRANGRSIEEAARLASRMDHAGAEATIKVAAKDDAERKRGLGVLGVIWSTDQKPPEPSSPDPLLASSSDSGDVALERSAATVEAFVTLVREAHGFPTDGPPERSVLEAVGVLARADRRYLEVVRGKLQKAGADRTDVDVFLRAVERRMSRRSIVLIPATEFVNRPDPEFLVDGLIEEGGLGVLYGPSGVYKTFLVLDWCFCIAAGLPWQGRDVCQGVVVYVAAEGGGGLSKRLRALCEHHGLAGLPAQLFIVNQGVNLLDPGCVAETIQAVEELGIRPTLVVFDTYARCMVGGDENSAKDTGLAIDGIDRLRFRLDTAALVVHHRGKDKKSSERGSGALRGASETMLEVVSGPSGVVLTVDKQKNFEAGPPIYLKPMPVGDSIALVETAAGPGGSKWGAAIEVAVELDQKKRERLVAAIVTRLKEMESAGEGPITQTKLLDAIVGHAATFKAEVLHELAADPDSPVEMDERGNAKFYRFSPRPVPLLPRPSF